jgi:uncharacterized glyoxalase superfamily protein PhnB
MESLTPNLFVDDMNQTIGFYSLLGFTVTMKVPESGDIVWAMMTNGKANMMFQTFASLNDVLPEISRINGGSLLFWIKVADIQSLFDSIEGKIPILKGLEKTFYGSTEFSILDNNKYVLTFAQDE